jgi:WD40 repeat protein
MRRRRLFYARCRFVKFWKKMVELVEFVKQFRAHLGRVNALVSSNDGLRVCTTGSDKAAKFFDVGARAPPPTPIGVPLSRLARAFSPALRYLCGGGRGLQKFFSPCLCISVLG